MSNIFRGLIRNENSFTQGLLNLLEHSKSLRENFAEQVNSKIEGNKFHPNDFWGNTIDNQRFINEEQPDIIIDTGDKILLIEIKIEPRTRPQESQRKLYYQSFEELTRCIKKERHFRFILPRNYHYISDIKNSIENKNKYSIDSAEIIYWEDIELKCLTPVIKKKNKNEVEKFLIKNYRDRLADKLSILNILFNEREVEIMKNPETFSIFIKLNKLFKRIEEHRDWTTYISPKDSSFDLYLKNKQSDQKVDIGIIITDNSEGSCLEDHLEIRVWNKPLKNNMYNNIQLDLKEIKESDGSNRYSYGFNKGIVYPNDELGGKIISIIDEIMEEMHT